MTSDLYGKKQILKVQRGQRVLRPERCESCRFTDIN